MSVLATAATYVGIAVVPAVVGVLAEASTIRTAVWVPVGLTVVLVAVRWRLQRQ